MPSLQLCFLTYNRKGIVVKCLQSMLPTLQDEETSWHIFDNASTDGTAQWLLKLAAHYPCISVHLSALNFGVAGGRFVQVEQAAADYLVILDSDVYALQADWLSPAIALLETNPQIGMVGAHGWYVRENLPYAWWKEEADLDYTGAVDCVSGYCQVARRDVYTLPDFMDKGYDWGGSEDDNSCAVALDAGYEVWQLAHMPLRHMYSGTWDKRDGSVEKGRKRYQAKWEAKGLMAFQKAALNG